MYGTNGFREGNLYDRVPTEFKTLQSKNKKKIKSCKEIEAQEIDSLNLNYPNSNEVDE